MEASVFTNELEYSQKGTTSIWTDPHISTQMLSAHLDPATDGASRKPETIRRTVEWVLDECGKRTRILDLGCGPGLYATHLASRGYTVTGIDINPVSIEYASQKAAGNHLSIDYSCGDYLSDSIGGMFDVAICIYCDLGALLPSDRTILLQRVFNLLCDDGLFLLGDSHPSYLKRI